MSDSSSRSSSEPQSGPDPRPTSVNDTRSQPGSAPAEADYPVDAGATRTSAFDAGRASNENTADRDPNLDIDA